MTAWKTYEEVARYLLEQFATLFDLERVEGKQRVPGSSGTRWEIDAKAVKIGSGGFLIVECRDHTDAGPSQREIAALCYQIRDTGASGGIIVSPHDLQSGANIVASHEGIHHVQLRDGSSNESYLFRFLNEVFVGATDVAALTLGESATVTVV
jgi:hypothetical protein